MQDKSAGVVTVFMGGEVRVNSKRRRRPYQLTVKDPISGGSGLAVLAMLAKILRRVISPR